MPDDSPNGTMAMAIGEKAYTDSVAAAVAASVEPVPPDQGISGGPLGILLWAAGVADEIAAWGTNVTTRDRQLRQFLTTESILGSAVSSVCARNAGFTWKLDGPPLTVKRAHDILHNADLGKGWLHFCIRYSFDLYSQDKGAFIETIRDGDSEKAPVLGIQVLDAARCWHTGIPEQPVIYQDSRGRFHRLKWYQVVTSVEMPMPHPTLYGLQFCAVSRVLQAARIRRDETTYIGEKVGGRHTRAVHMVGGVNKKDMSDAIEATQRMAEQRGQTRYIAPAIVVGLKPDIAPNVATLALSSLPDGFDPAEALKEYLTIISMGLFTDFQEFAPLPGGGLGTSMQSEILHLKSRGKGPMLFRKGMEHLMNFSGVLPTNVQFEYDEQDVDADKASADVAKVRAEAWKLLADMGAIDAQAVRQLGLDAGDIPQELFDALSQGQPDITGVAPFAQPDDQTTASEEEQVGQRAASRARAGPRNRRLELEQSLEAALDPAFAEAMNELGALLKRG